MTMKSHTEMGTCDKGGHGEEGAAARGQEKPGPAGHWEAGSKPCLSFHLVGSLKLLAGRETVTQVLGGLLSPAPPLQRWPLPGEPALEPNKYWCCSAPSAGGMTAVSQLAGRQCRAGPAGIACPTQWLPAHKPVTALSSASQGAGTPRPAESAEHPLHLSSCSGAQVHSQVFLLPRGLCQAWAGRAVMPPPRMKQPAWAQAARGLRPGDKEIPWAACARAFSWLLLHATRVFSGLEVTALIEPGDPQREADLLRKWKV